MGELTNGMLAGTCTALSLPEWRRGLVEEASCAKLSLYVRYLKTLARLPRQKDTMPCSRATRLKQSVMPAEAHMAHVNDSVRLYLAKGCSE